MKRWVLWIILFTALVFGVSAAGAYAENVVLATPSEWDLLLEQGRDLLMQEKFPQASLVVERALVLAGKQSETINPESGPGQRVTTQLYRLGAVYSSRGRYAEAELLFQRALIISEESLGSDHPDTGSLMNELANLYISQGRYTEAEPLYNRSIINLEKTLGADHPDIAKLLNNLARLYMIQGRYSEAEMLYHKGLIIHEKALGANYPGADIATSLNNLARLCSERGRYAEAESFYRRALEIYETAAGSDDSNVNVGASLNNLASLYEKQGRSAEAESLYQRAVLIFERAVGPNHTSVGTLLNNLACSYDSLGRYADAERSYQRALVIAEKALGTNHTVVGTSLNNLALLYTGQGRYAEAEPLYQRAISIFEKALGSDHPDVGRLLNNLAKLCASQGHYTEAESFYLRALTIYDRSALGSDHPEVAKLLKNLADLYFSLGDIRALEFAQRAFNAESSVSAESFSMLSERQRMDFIGHRGNLPLRIAASLALQQPDCDSEASRVAWQMVLRSKAAVLDAMLEDRQNLSGNPEAEALFTRLGEVKSRLSALQIRDLTKFNTAELVKYRSQMDTMQKERDDLEQSLARISGRFREGRRAAKVTAEEVGKALPENTALVEFLYLTPLIPAGPDANPDKPKDAPPQYVAFVLTDGNVPPKFIPVGDAGNIDTLIDSCRKKMERGAAVTNDLRELYQLVWAPLEAYTINKRRILISPDGALNQLSFAALRTPGERYLIERYEIGYLASGRDLIRNMDVTRPTPPALFGDPIFTNRSPIVEKTAEPRSRLFRSISGDQDRAMYRRLKLPALPATRDEVDQISKILSARTPSVFLGSDASEENLKKALRPEMLHLATHGFYFAEPEAAAGTNLTVEAKSRTNPMLRSGLALSGASASFKGEMNLAGEDGIVTAEEVGSLDLWGTKLVVLSACNTGRGENLSGEGVFGLRRAFVQAGALNLMLTLWQVEDTFTKNLMLAFYRDYIQTGDAVGALSRVQRDLLTKNGPRFWAPFLVSVQGCEQNRDVRM